VGLIVKVAGLRKPTEEEKKYLDVLEDYKADEATITAAENWRDRAGISYWRDDKSLVRVCLGVLHDRDIMLDPKKLEKFDRIVVYRGM
jgi:hypothetical protein